MGSEGEVMSYGKMTLTFFFVTALLALYILGENIHKFFPGITRVGEFKTGNVSHEVYDLKAGNRACLVVSSQFENEPAPRFFFSCPQER